MRIQLGTPGQHVPDAREVQPDLHHARDDDGLPRRRAGVGRLRELPRAADDRRARRRLPAPQRVVVLDVPVRRHRALRVGVLHAARGGWFSYVPLSAKEYSPSNGQDAWIYMVHLTGLSSMLGAVNFIATIHNMRAPGMGWGRLPLFVLDDPDLRVPDRDRAVLAGRDGDDAADRPQLRHQLLRSRPRAARRCCGSTCSGSSATPRSTSSSCPRSASSPRCCRCSPASRSSATRRSPRRPRPSPSSGCSCGRTTCSRRRCRRWCSRSSCSRAS